MTKTFRNVELVRVGLTARMMTDEKTAAIETNGETSEDRSYMNHSLSRAVRIGHSVDRSVMRRNALSFQLRSSFFFPHVMSKRTGPSRAVIENVDSLLTYM